MTIDPEILFETEAKLIQAIREYLEARTDGFPLDDMTDEAMGAMKEALLASYGADLS